MSYDLRVISGDESDAAWRLSSVAFGYHAEPPPPQWRVDAPGRTPWGAFDVSGRLVGKAVDREQSHWFGGRTVPAAGVAGVAVAPESRGRGLARALLTRLLVSARERGAVISTLFPTTEQAYRQLGWETVGALTYAAWPASSLARAAAGEEVALRPAEVADVPAIEGLYREVARASSGLMERSGPLYTTTPEQLLAAFDGLTVAAAPDGTIAGYASWNRGPGYDETGKLTVFDLIGVNGDATSALLAMLGSWASVAPTVVLRLSPTDPAPLLVSAAAARTVSHQPWMIRLIDAAGAVAARGWPPHLQAEIDVDLLDAECPWNAGRHRLMIADGAATLRPGGDGRVRFTARGLAAWWAGAVSPAVLRRASLLDGDSGSDPQLLAATAGPVPALLDYF